MENHDLSSESKKGQSFDNKWGNGNSLNPASPSDTEKLSRLNASGLLYIKRVAKIYSQDFHSIYTETTATVEIITKCEKCKNIFFL
jgi:hypothetical protein